MRNISWLRGRDLGLHERSITGAGTISGIVIPWRIKYAFQTAVVHVWASSGNMNCIPRVRYYDATKTLRGTSGRELQNPATTQNPTVWFVKDNTVRSSAGSPTNTATPMIFMAPYIEWQIQNSDAGTVVYNMEVMLLDGVV